MTFFETSEEICRCGGKVAYLRNSPNHVSGHIAPQDEIWSCQVCGKCYLKSWSADNIDFFTEKGDIDGHLEEFRADHRYCTFCNAYRQSEDLLYRKQPACRKCFLLQEWESRYKRGEVKTAHPSELETSDFLAGLRAMEYGSYQEACDRLRPFAEGGSALAEYNLGQILEKGPPALRNPVLAKEWYLKAARQMVAEAYLRVGKICAEDRQIGVDLVEAYKWFNLGAYCGDAACVAAREAIAGELSHDEVFKAQEESVLDLKKPWNASDFRKRICENLKKARGELEGMMKYAEILEGRTVEAFLVDYKESEKIYRSLAEDRFPPAMGRLGEKMTRGEWIARNLEEGAQWLSKSISRQYFPAVEFAWNEICAGTELKIDVPWLKSCFLAEIEAGNHEAIYAWGVINQSGKGVAEDFEEAHKWLNIARYLGKKFPVQNPMEALERRLSFQQLEKAENSAQEWLEKHQGKLPIISRLRKLFRERVMAQGKEKWLRLGELFRSGSEGFLRHAVLAYGCIELALRSGDTQARAHLETLAAIVPAEQYEKAFRYALEIEKTGNMPILSMKKD